MTIYIATVGNDPAPVALGFLEARRRADITQAVLLYDPPRGPNEAERQKALGRWLEARGVTVQRGTEGLAAEALAGAVFNLTGGQKPSTLPLLRQAQEVKGTALVVDAHGDELLIHDLLAATSAPATHHLGLDDYLELYLPAGVQQAALLRLLSAFHLPPCVRRQLGDVAQECRVTPPAHRVRKGQTAWGIQELTLWWVIQESRLLLVWDVRRLPMEKIQERLRLLVQRTREIGGQLATPVFLFESGVVGEPLSDFVLYDLRAQWLDEDGWYSAEAPEALPDLQPTAAPAKAVYVALLGEQPMPPLLGLQAQPETPERVYLLCTPQVRLTGERIKAVLEQSPETAGQHPEWAGRVQLLPVEAQTPASIREQLGRIREAHPAAKLTLNLTGGTKALALHAELWAAEAEDARTEYAQGHWVNSGGVRSDPLWHLTLTEELQVRGVEISESRPLPPVSPALKRAAEQLFEQDKPQHKQAFFEALKNHLPASEQFGEADVTAGLAGEYLAIADLMGAIPTGRMREMVWATKLTFPGGSKREIDGLAVLSDGRLLILEVKRNLVSGIETDHEHGQTPALGERLAGLDAHSLLVGRVPSGSSPSGRWQQALAQSEKASLSSPYSLWAMHHQGTLPAGLRRFPEDLPAFLGSV